MCGGEPAIAISIWHGYFCAYRLTYSSCGKSESPSTRDNSGFRPLRPVFGSQIHPAGSVHTTPSQPIQGLVYQPQPASSFPQASPSRSSQQQPFVAQTYFTQYGFGTQVPSTYPNQGTTTMADVQQPFSSMFVQPNLSVSPTPPEAPIMRAKLLVALENANKTLIIDPD